MRAALLVAASALLGLPACRLSEKMVRVDTSPPGAMVNVNGLFAGTAPCECVVPRTRGPIEFEVLPPRDATERLWTQQRSFTWGQLPSTGAVIYFDLRLERTQPVQPVEVRER